MAIGCGILALILAVAGIIRARAGDRGMAAFLLVCAFLNGAAAADMAISHYTFAWKLAPSEAPDLAYHHDR